MFSKRGCFDRTIWHESNVSIDLLDRTKCPSNTDLNSTPAPSVLTGSEVWETEGQDEKPQVKGLSRPHASIETLFLKLGLTRDIQINKTYSEIILSSLGLSSCQWPHSLLPSPSSDCNFHSRQIRSKAPALKGIREELVP